MIATVARGVAGWWNAFWFSPAPALNLAAARVVFAVHAIWILGSRDLPAISGVPPVFWARVPAGDSWRFLLFHGHEPLERVLHAAAVAALVAAAIGLWPRIACLCAGLLLYHLAPLETIFWSPNAFERGLTVSVVAMLALSFSRCGDALALWPRPASPALPSADYRWPVQLVQIFVCQVYFIAGYAKIYRAGFAWVSGENIQRWLTVFSQQDQVAVWRPLGLWLADRPVACWLIAAGALALDLGLISIVVWPRLRKWLIPAALSFHAGILLTMGILFLNVPQFLVFVNWARFTSPRGVPAIDRQENTR